MEDKMKTKITLQDIEDIVYYASLRSGTRNFNNHFHGIVPFLDRINQDNEKIIEELDYIKLAIQQLVEKPIRTRKKKKVIEE